MNNQIRDILIDNFQLSVAKLLIAVLESEPLCSVRVLHSGSKIVTVEITYMFNVYNVRLYVWDREETSINIRIDSYSSGKIFTQESIKANYINSIKDIVIKMMLEELANRHKTLVSDVARLEKLVEETNK